MKLKNLMSVILCGFLFMGCGSSTSQTSQDILNNAQIETSVKENDVNISVASVAISQVLSEMNQEIVGRPTTKLELPDEYVAVPEIGSSFSPDFEKVLAVGTELLIGDYLFKDKIESTAKEYGIDTFYIDTSTYDKFLYGIEELGKKINKEQEANEILQKFKEPLSNLSDSSNSDLKVAIISGTSESNTLATEDSYVGSLVRALGVTNVATLYSSSDNNYQSTSHNSSNSYINLNLEQLLVNQPDVILIFGHGNIDEANNNFKKLFEENPAWKNLEAVKNNKIYNLDPNIFGTSANMRIDEALTKLGEIFDDNK